jgi:hypothetical protein
MRTTVARELFPEEASSLSRYGARYWQLSLLVPWVMLINFLVSSVTRRIEWRGTHYELKDGNQTRVIRREKSRFQVSGVRWREKRVIPNSEW